MIRDFSSSQNKLLQVCTMSRGSSPKGMRMYFDPKQRFVEKLFEVVQDDYLLKWNNEGTSILLHSHNYEDKVMSAYPGFVTMPNFRNFRNFCRQYGFICKKRRGANFEFTHALFQRDKKELLSQMSCCKRGTSGVDGPSRPPGRPPNSGKKAYATLKTQRKPIDSNGSFGETPLQEGPSAFMQLAKESLQDKHIHDVSVVEVPSSSYTSSTLVRKDFDCDPVSVLTEAASHIIIPASKFCLSPKDDGLLLCSQAADTDRRVLEIPPPIEDNEIAPTPGFEWMYMYPEVEDDLDHDLFSIIGDLPSLSRYIPPSSTDFLPGIMYRLSGPHPYPPRFGWPARRF